MTQTTNDTEAIKNFGINWNRKQRENEKRKELNIQYQKDLNSIGIEILNKSLFYFN